MYFEDFPLIGYAVKIDGKEQLVLLKDIALNVRVRKSIISNIVAYDYYDIQEGETPHIVAHKFYKDSNLHWVIMLLNERFDYRSDWPMSSGMLSEYVTQKYGAGHEYDIHSLFGKPHWVLPNGTVVDAGTELAKSVSNFDYEFELNESKRRIKIIHPSLVDQVVKELTNLMESSIE